MNKVRLGNSLVEVHDDSIEFWPSKIDGLSLRNAFLEQGFVVIRNAVPTHMLERVNFFFDGDIKHSTDFFQRQMGGTHPHTITTDGYMKQGLVNVQDFTQRRYGRFRDNFLNVVTSEFVYSCIQPILQEEGTVVHTMYFEGNAQTPAHRDSHTIDSEEEGRLIGIWIAAQDINPEAGRFYLLEGSHKIKTPDSYDGGTWGETLTNWIAESELRLVAPVLSCGDIIIFHSHTVHGSLPTINSAHSRRSVTCHYIPRSQGMTWFRSIQSQTTVKGTESEMYIVNNIPIMLHGHSPVSQLKMWRNTIRRYLSNKIRTALTRQPTRL